MTTMACARRDRTSGAKLARLAAAALLAVALPTQTANAATALRQQGLLAAGGMLSGGSLSLVAVVGEPVGGLMSQAGTTVLGGYPPAWPPLSRGRRTISVYGTVDDQAATVTVNDRPATMTQGLFRSDDVELLEGPNAIRVAATDQAGNRRLMSITVHLATQLPARPTIALSQPLAATSSFTLTGTKTSGTAIWINGAQAVAPDSSTTWSAALTLREGDNVVSVIAKTAAGNSSTAATSTIVLDTLPPAITIPSSLKTNLTPYPLTGTVDDSLTAVRVNGVSAARAGMTFQASVTLLAGSNSVTVTATSPRGYVSTKTVAITLGTIPRLVSISPPAAAKLYSDAPAVLQANATDQEGDPLEHQMLLDGEVLFDWSSQATRSWTPSVAQHGRHTVEIRSRDSFGGYASMQSIVAIIRKPIAHP